MPASKEQEPPAHDSTTSPVQDDPRLPAWARPAPEALAEAEPAEKAMEEALSEIKTAAQAEQVADELMAAAGEKTELDVRAEGGAAPHPAQAIAAAAQATQGTEKASATLLEAAKEVASTTGETREALEQKVLEATHPELQGVTAPALQAERELLRDAILRRMKPLQAIDARLFLAVNHLPHPLWMNQALYGLTLIMNGGWGWVIGLVGAAICDKRRGLQALHQVVPPLWFATMTVEYPIKYYFRRRRPFIDIVQAIAVGRKPGTWSFPSGHSAAAFAGAWLLRRHYPKLAGLWYAIAALVGFSRIYLGAHYPGDVVSGALAGTAIAEATRWVIDQADTPVERHPVARRLRRWF
jgi:undecaprenyl-diphosphatase